MKVQNVRQNMDKVTIELGGKTRVIRYDLNAFAELENKYGTIQAAFKELEKGSMVGVKTILWAGLIHEEVELDETGEPIRYNISPYKVGGWIDPKMIPTLSEKIMKSLGFAVPDPENLPEDVKNKLKEQGIDINDLATVVPTEEELEKND